MSRVPRGVWVAAAAVFLSALLTAALIPLLDPDEGYYPATAAESADTGGYWDLRFNGGPRWDKPILSYALIQASFAIFGRSVAAARVPSAFEGFLLVLVVGFVVSLLAGESAAVVCAAVAATTLGIQVFARVAHPEMAVVLAITTAELLFAVYLCADPRRRRGVAALIGIAIGFGILTKGPVALVLPALTVLAARPFLRHAQPSRGDVVRDVAIGLGVALLIAAPWYVAMTVRHGGEFVAEALWRHNVVRYAGGDFGHRQGVLYFVVPTLVSMLPWTMFLGSALGAVDRRDRSPGGILRIVAVSAAATAFLFYSLSASKLPHYALAFVPPLAILIGLEVTRELDEGADRRRELRLTAVVHGLLGLAIIALPWLVGRVFTARELLGGSPLAGSELQSLLARAILPTGLVLLAFGAVLLRSGRRRAVALTIGLGAVLPALFVLSARPLLDTTYPWDRLGHDIRGTDRHVWMVGPRAPSLTFFASHPVARITQAELSAVLSAGADGWIVVDTNWLRASKAAQRFPQVSIDIRENSGTMTLARVHASQQALR